jgi:hypothetical protein
MRALRPFLLASEGALGEPGNRATTPPEQE